MTSPIQVSSFCEESRSSVVETRKHLRLISRRNRPNRTGRFFCAFSKVVRWYSHLHKLFLDFCF